MISRFSDATMRVLQVARDESVLQGALEIGTESLLVALTDEAAGVASSALALMGVDGEKAKREAKRVMESNARDRRRVVSQPAAAVPEVEEEPWFSESAIETFRLAQDYRRYFGQEEVEPEHLLLGVLDLKEAGALKMLDELGANLTFLRRQVVHLMAEVACLYHTTPSLQSALVSGLTDLISVNLESVDSLMKLAEHSGVTLKPLPDRRDIVFMVCVGYLPEFLSMQIAFQRCLLEETLKVLAERTGPLDQEVMATLVSNSAQHLRTAVQSTLEFLWSHEYRLFDQMLDEAEHDLIGSVIEDLWWAHSEEIAVHELFDEALDDHRRKQALSLQKRRVEITQRISKLRTRLAETIRQCFTSRRIPA